MDEELPELRPDALGEGSENVDEELPELRPDALGVVSENVDEELPELRPDANYQSTKGMNHVPKADWVHDLNYFTSMLCITVEAYTVTFSSSP